MRGLLAGSAAVTVAMMALPASPLLSIVVERAASFVDGRRNPYDDRPEIWREAIRQIVLRPVLGSGPGGYPLLALRTRDGVATVAPNHAHDLALTLAAEQGLVGVVALAAAIAVVVIAVVRTLRSWPRNVRETADRRAGEDFAGRGLGPGRKLAIADVTIPGLTVPDHTVAPVRSRTIVDAPRDPDHTPRRSVAAPRGTPGERELLAGVVAGLAVVLGQGLVDYSLRNPVLATMVWLLIGLLAAIVSGRDEFMRRGAGPVSWKES
jgi:hypothetical protein